MTRSLLPARSFWTSRIGLSLLPGFLLGTLFAQLLSFLNPHLPYTPRVLLPAVLGYGGVGALVSLALGVALGGRRPRRATRWVPWGITAAIGSAASLGWVLPSYFAFFLPPPMNIRLIKAAAWLTAAALVSFYTVLLHSLARRRYGWRSRIGLALCVVAAVAAMAERRGAYPLPRPPAGRPTAIDAPNRPPLLVVGLDAATLEAILPLAEQGSLPFFARLLEGGAHGHLASLRPFRAGSLWATVATGKLPYEHGVVARRRYPVAVLPDGLALKLVPPFQPFRGWAKLFAPAQQVDSGDLAVLPLWQILARLGVRTSVVGWPLSSPVSAEPAAMVGDRFFTSPDESGAVWPSELREPLVALRRAAQAAPLWTEDPAEMPLDEDVRGAARGDRWRLEVAEKLAAEGWSSGALFLVLPGLKEVSERSLGGYAAVQFEGERRAPYREAAGSVTAYYGLLDRFLAELWQLQGERGLLAVVSAYGTAPARGLRWAQAAVSERYALRGYFDRSPPGVFVLYGEGVRAGARVDGAQLADVVPTLLYAAGLPVAGDFHGQVLRPAFEPAFLASRPLTFLPSYEVLRATAPGETP